MGNVVSFHDGSGDGRAIAAQCVSGVSGRLRQGEQESHVNFVQEESAETLRAGYPADTWPRLVAGKRRNDPTDRFHMNHNIRPEPR